MLDAWPTEDERDMCPIVAATHERLPSRRRAIRCRNNVSNWRRRRQHRAVRRAGQSSVLPGLSSPFTPGSAGAAGLPLLRVSAYARGTSVVIDGASAPDKLPAKRLLCTRSRLAWSEWV